MLTREAPDFWELQKYELRVSFKNTLIWSLLRVDEWNHPEYNPKL